MLILHLIAGAGAALLAGGVAVLLGAGGGVAALAYALGGAAGIFGSAALCCLFGLRSEDGVKTGQRKTTSSCLPPPRRAGSCPRACPRARHGGGACPRCAMPIRASPPTGSSRGTMSPAGPMPCRRICACVFRPCWTGQGRRPSRPRRSGTRCAAGFSNTERTPPPHCRQTAIPAAPTASATASATGRAARDSRPTPARARHDKGAAPRRRAR